MTKSQIDINATVTHIVQKICPALHCNALEDGENSKQDVVKLRDSVVRTKPVFLTFCTIGTESRGEFSSTRKLFPNFICQKQTQTFINPPILLPDPDHQIKPFHNKILIETGRIP